MHIQIIVRMGNNNLQTSPVESVDELVSIRDTGSESDSILWMWSPDQTSETVKVSEPLATLSFAMEIPKQKDFPIQFLIGIGRIFGSSICKSQNYYQNYT